MTASGMRASRSISSGSTDSTRNARRRARNASPFAIAAGIELRLRVDEVEPQVAEEELLAEARLLPALLARALGDLSGFLLADLAGHDDS